MGRPDDERAVIRSVPLRTCASKTNKAALAALFDLTVSVYLVSTKALLFAVLRLEFIDSARGIDDLVLARVERVRGRRNLHGE